ncbi:MAG: energy transducer TonB [Magnetococcales bacterium]|nr:energy transducer TonB [Magnetococcales bacterium]
MAKRQWRALVLSLGLHGAVILSLWDGTKVAAGRQAQTGAVFRMISRPSPAVFVAPPSPEPSPVAEMAPVPEPVTPVEPPPPDRPREVEKPPAIPTPPSKVRKVVRARKTPRQKQTPAAPPDREVVPEAMGDLPEATHFTPLPAAIVPREVNRETGLDRQPEVGVAYASNPRPVYPVQARRMGQEGTVILSVEVTADGGVARVSIRTSSGYESLDRAAVEAVTQWRFTPAQRHGRRVAATVGVPIRFRLGED